MLDLVGRGVLDPTAEAVAVHAGVGYRTVFRHFEDMEALFDELNAKITQIVLAGLPDLPPEGPLADRISGFVMRRTQVFEAITNYYLSGNIRLHSSESLRRSRANFAQMLRRQQAEAIISARSKIVHGAVSMVEAALKGLSEREIVVLDDERKAAMVSNLLVVLCSDHDAQPIINAGTLYN